MNLIVGIDPGLTGAVAVITTGGDFVTVEDMPLQFRAGKNIKKKRQVDPVALGYLFAAFMKLGTIERVSIELVSARTGQGVTGVFSFGDSFGVLRGVVGAIGLPVDFVSPQSWKRNAGLLKTDKDESRLLALRKWHDAPLTRKKDHGRADALLIAAHWVQ